MKKTTLLLLTLSILFISCKQLNYQDYFFKVSQFDSPKIYVFKNQLNSIQTIRMKMYYEIIKSDTVFISETLNEENKPTEVFKEIVDNSGSLMVDYYYVNYTSNGESEKESSKVINNSVFSYSEVNYPLTWKVQTGEGQNTLTITKKRSLLNEIKKLDILNLQRNCIVFSDEIIIQDNNSSAISEINQKSYYAKGLGLVGYDRVFSNGDTLEYRLSEIN